MSIVEITLILLAMLIFQQEKKLKNNFLIAQINPETRQNKVTKGIKVTYKPQLLMNLRKSNLEPTDGHKEMKI